MQIKYKNKNSLLPAAEIIKNGGLVAFPTETVYGLGANALDPDAAKKIYAAKGRPSDNPLIVHLSRAEDAVKYCDPPELFKKIAGAFMPGPITVIMPKKDCIPKTVTGGLDSVGIRVPSNHIARELIELSGVPIAAPSANISGKPSPTKFGHIVHDLDGRVDCMIDGGDCLFGVESTIIKIGGDGVALLRPGAITVEMLAAVVGEVRIDPAVTAKFDGVPMAPGMKYRHYAPSVPVVIFDGGDDDFYKLVNGSDCGVICFDEDLPHIEKAEKMSCGPKGDSLAQAKNIFAVLRHFDGMTNIPVIYARMPSKEGIGLAVFNRLVKAAGFNIIKNK